MSTKLDSSAGVISSPQLWTPSLTFSVPGNLSFAGVNADGVYQKVGNLVFFDFKLVATPTFTTASGGAIISLPLPIASISGSSLVGVLNSYLLPLTGVSIPAGTFETFIDLGSAGSSASNLVYQTSSTFAALQASNFTSGSVFSLRGGGRYYTP